MKKEMSPFADWRASAVQAGLRASPSPQSPIRTGEPAAAPTGANLLDPVTAAAPPRAGADPGICKYIIQAKENWYYEDKT